MKKRGGGWAGEGGGGWAGEGRAKMRRRERERPVAGAGRRLSSPPIIFNDIL